MMRGMQMHVVILAGGRGERFWPLSRRDRPKQVLSLMGERSLLEETLARVEDRVDAAHTWIVAGADQRAVLRSLSLELPSPQYLWEPLGRNTGPAIAAAAEWILAEDPSADPLLLVLPSDHWIPEPNAFWSSVERGLRLLERPGQANTLVTFGILPTRPETGYGYVERDVELEEPGTFRVARFHEKPDGAHAEAYLRSGGVYWNAGIFLFRARALADAFRAALPEFAPVLDRLREDLRGGLRAVADPDEDARWRAFFEAAPSISIDHGLMESAPQVAVVEADFPWTDLGGWLAWADYQKRDARDNRYHGQVMCLDASNNLVYSESPGVVALLGVDDLIVVRVRDVTLVCPQDRAQEVRRMARAIAADPGTTSHA